MRFCFRQPFILLSLLAGLALMPPAVAQPAEDFRSGVEAYRNGRFQEAEAIFSRLHEARREDGRITYYLAMTQAQLGRYRQARQLYEEVILLDPNGEVGQLARQGMQYLPPDTAALDPPPRFDASQPATTVQPGATPPAGGMSMQDIMALQMMMGQQQPGAGFNPLPWMLMGQSGGTQSSFGNIDPNVMSTMMMNQMMSNFDFTGETDRDR